MSSNKWPRHSVVAEAKPLFVKELSKLWENLPVAYGPHNTILIDNHMEKFEGNPLGTCILVSEFTAETNDDLLKPGGELCRHLDALAACESTTAYIMGQDSPLFPKVYPTPPPTAEVSGTPLVAMLTSFCSSKCLNSLLKGVENKVEWCLSRKDLMGPRACALRRRDLPLLLEKRFVVGEKSDGKRGTLFIKPEDSTMWLFDRAFGATPIEGAEILRKELTAKGGVTILDGELVDCMESNKGYQKYFLVFDVVRLDGEDVGASMDLMSRLQQLEATARCGSPGVVTGADLGLITSPFRASVCCKRFYELNRLGDLLGCLKTGQGGKGYDFFDGERRSRSDGLVFTPVEAPYYDYMVYKYKPMDLITVDFRVLGEDLSKATGRGGLLPLYLNAMGRFIQLGRILVTQEEAEESLEHVEDRGHGKEVVLECAYNTTKGLWTFKAVRADKIKCNSLGK